MPPSTNSLAAVIGGALVVAVVLTACSSASSPVVDLGAADVGCVLTFGDEPARTIGPVGMTRDVAVSVSPDTTVTIGNSRTSLHITVRRGPAERTVTVDHDDIPGSGYTMEDSWIDAEHPGYRIVCVHG